MNLKNTVLRIFFIGFFALLHSLSFSQDRLRISLLTLTPGQELNEAFGHSAIRVIDSNAVTDHVYNYGTFDFDDPNFYLKFVKGQLRYYVNIESFNDFVFYYKQMQRGITEQVLNLTEAEERKIKNVLNENVKEENKYYQYEFFKDNCTTRLRDIIKKNHSPAPILPAVMPSTFTYRNAIHQYLNKGNMHWSKLGIDILLGAKTDAVMTSDEQEFLPDNLMHALDSCSNTSMVASSKQIYPFEEGMSLLSFFKPMFFSFAILLFFMAVHLKKLFFGNVKKLSSRNQGFIKFLDYFLFSIVGLLGVLLIFMWWGTDHSMTKNNYNLLWASPLFLVYAFVLHKKTVVVKKLFFYGGLFLLGVLCSWYFLPQQLNVALIPIVLLLAWRLVDNSERFLKVSKY
jgi:hypothetical protein